jgi:hypothetical protein
MSRKRDQPTGNPPGGGAWLCYCGESPIPLGQPCPRCGWDGHEDGDAAEIAWSHAQAQKDAAHNLVSAWNRWDGVVASESFGRLQASVEIVAALLNERAARPKEDG